MRTSLFKLSLLDNRFPALHGIRSIMIMMTILLHISLYFSLFNFIGNSPALVDYLRLALNFGWQAMDLFFVMSGFLIGRILFKTFESESKGTIRFYLRRSFRTLPLYYVSLVLLWGGIQIWPSLSVNGITEPNWFAEIFYLTNYMKDKNILAPWSWSLSVEEHFYLAGPLLISLLLRLPKHKLRLAFLGFIILLALVFRLEKFFSTEQGEINIFRDLFIPTHMRIDTFAWGLLAAYLNYFFNDQMAHFFKSAVVRATAWLLIFCLFYLFLHPVFNQYPFMYLSYGGPAPDSLVRAVALKNVFYFGTLSGLLYFLLILVAVYTNNKVIRFLSRPFFHSIATLSYGSYLVHLPLTKIITEVVPIKFPSLSTYPEILWLLCFVVTVSSSFFLSYILHLVVEKPVLFLRDRWVP